MKSLWSGPVAIGVDSTGMKFYKGGLHKCKNTVKIDHAVVAVGFYVFGRWLKFYKIRNSYGKDWGY